MSERLAWMHGQWLPEAELRISPYDLSVMQGVAAFEMTRSFHGKTFLLDEHLARLEQSCKLLEIPLTYSRDDLRKVCDEIVERNAPAFAPDDEHRLMIVASLGCAPMYAGFPGVIAEPWVYVMDFPLRSTVRGMGQDYQHGVYAGVVHHMQVPNQCIPSTAKHRSRLHFYLAQSESWRRTFDWGILTDAENHVAEAPGANIFVVHNERISTPWRNCLFGVSRGYVCHLLKQVGQTVYASDIDEAHLEQATEVFLSATPFCLLPIVGVNKRSVGDGTPGPVYRQLLQAWSDSVNLDIAAQVQRWDSQG